MTIPDQMCAAIIRQHGGPEAIKIERVATPKPGSGDVLIAVAAVGLNHLDVFAREGLKGPGVPPVHLPHVSGVDIAGVIAAQGEGVSEPRVGARVLVNPSVGCGVCKFCRRGEYTMCAQHRIIGEHLWGGLAEYVVVPARNVILLPEQVRFTQAAAVPAAYTTAWRAVVTVGQLRVGERVLIVGASGGVACAALQIAVQAGARVYATVGSAAKRKRALELGAEKVFDSHAHWGDAVLRETNDEGVNLVLDAVGAPTWRQSIQSLAMEGRMVISGATGGDNPAISIREIYQWHRRILGAPLGNWQDFMEVTQLVFNGAIVPEVFAVYPLEKIAEAEQALDERKHFGKIVIEVAGDGVARK